MLPASSEVIVIGGGPAGSTVSTLLARKGREVLVLEKERFPRFHIGESLITETYWPLEKLGVLDRLKESASPVKASVQFYSANGKPSRPFYFFESNDHPSAYTWQVERSWFDQMLLENAREKGVQAHEGVNVREVLFEGDRAVGVLAEDEAGQRFEIRSQVVVDASGLGAFLGRRLGLVRKDPRLVKAAVFAHYHGALRDDGIDEGATLILSTHDSQGWFWYIPLSGDRVSVGLVGNPRDLFSDGRKPEEILEAGLETCPEVKRRVAPATRSTEARVLSDFSYRCEKAAGEGWVLVGDAFGFLDPVYSSGAFLALKSGEFAAESIQTAFEENDFSGERLGSFHAELVRGMENFRKLIYAFYAPDFSFSNFIREHPEHRERLTDILIGAVFKDGVEEIFENLKDFCDLSVPPTPAGT